MDDTDIQPPVSVPIEKIDWPLPEGSRLLGKEITVYPDGTARALADVAGALCVIEGRIRPQ